LVVLLAVGIVVSLAGVLLLVRSALRTEETKVALLPETDVPEVVVPQTIAPAPPSPQPTPEVKPEPPPLRVAESTPDPLPPVTIPDVPKTEADNSEKPAEALPAGVRPSKIVVKRRQLLDEEDLKKRIRKIPEVALDTTAERRESQNLIALARTASPTRREVGIGPETMQKRPDLAGLAMRMGDACKISPTLAEHLQGGSVTLRRHLFEAANATAARGGAGVTGDTRPDPNHLFKSMNSGGDRYNKWHRTEAVPALMQLLMAENEAVRTVLIDQLASIEGPRASLALANRAVFDLNADIRKAAIEALAKRPVSEYQQVLLSGLTYPWAVIADHAAEAIVALDLKEALPKLVGLLDAPDPSAPRLKPGHPNALVVKEMVRVNHLRNCVMCHAASFDENDKVRGFVPPPNQPLPPSFTQEYYAPKQHGIFVRADITYLQQDFSTPLPVTNHGIWPEVQRFDFLVRERTLQPLERVDFILQKDTTGQPTAHQQALFFTLRHLTNEDPGPTVEDWKRLVLAQEKVKLMQTSLHSIGGIAADSKGTVYASDLRRGVLVRIDSNGSKDLTSGVQAAFEGMQVTSDGRIIACLPAKGQVVAVDVATGTTKVLADSLQDERINCPTHLCVDRRGGIYFTDAVNMNRQGDHGGLYYISSKSTVTRLAHDLTDPRGVAITPDGDRLYVGSSSSSVIVILPLESAGNPGKAQVLGRLSNQPGRTSRGCHGMTVDSVGNLFVANPLVKVVDVYNPEGAVLGSIRIPEKPQHLAVSGKLLIISTAEALYTMPLKVSVLGGVATR
jgi:sugar lactone lactonase YvrE